MLILRLMLKHIGQRARPLEILIHNSEMVSNIFNLGLAFLTVNFVTLE